MPTPSIPPDQLITVPDFGPDAVAAPLPAGARWLAGLLLVSTALAMASFNRVVDLDLFHEMALFRQIVTNGQVPLADDFAYTPTRFPVVHHEWGTGGVLYLVTVTAGLGSAGLMGLKFLLMLLTGYGAWRLARKQGAGFGTFCAAAVVAIAIGGAVGFTNVRAQMFTLVFLVAGLHLLELDRRGRKVWIVLWLMLVVVWVNMHGGVVAGLGILLVHAAARVMERWIASRSVETVLRETWYLVPVGLASGLVLTINPYGWQYVPYLFRAIEMDRPLIGEWQGMFDVQSAGAIALFFLSLAAGLWSCWRRGPAGLFAGMALLLTAWLSVRHVRHLSIYATVWVCLVPAILPRGTTEWKQLVNRILVSRTGKGLLAVAAAGLLTMATWNRFWELQIPHRAVEEGVPAYPVGVVNWLESNHKGQCRAIVPFGAGSYVSWYLYPQVLVSIDSRYEVAYPPGAVEQNEDFFYAVPGWEKYLEYHHPTAAIVPVDAPVAEEMLQRVEDGMPGSWKPVYRDDGFLLFLKDPGPAFIEDRSGIVPVRRFP